MAKFIVAYTMAPPGAPLPEVRGVLEDSGLDVELVLGVCRTEDDAIQLGQEADILIVGGGGVPVTHRVMEQTPRCRAVVCYGHGYDNIDVSAATEHGIVVANVPTVGEEVADHTIAMILACERKLVRLDRAIRAGGWQRGRRDSRMQLRPMALMKEQTLGLVGMGRIAQYVARRALALEMKCLSHDPFMEPAAIREHGVEPVELDELLARSDFVSLHTPLTEATHHLISARELRLMKPSAYLINTSRGPVVDEDALISALQEGWIAGAGLDVFEVEPLPADSPLRELDSVILTPHSAGSSDARRARMHTQAAEEVVRVLEGYWPVSLVNPEVKGKVSLREC